MTAYIIRRLLSVIPITLGVLLLVFLIYRVIGGDPAARLAGKNATPAKIEQIRKTFGYDKPKFFGFWVQKFFRAQPGAGLGVVPVSGQTVWEFCLNLCSFRLAVVSASGQTGWNFKPAQGATRLAVALPDFDARQRYRMEFRVEAPQGCSLRVLLAHPGAKPENQPIILEKSLSNNARTFVTADIAPTVDLDAADGGTAQVTVEITGGEATVSALQVWRAQSNPFDSQFWQIVSQFAQLNFGKSLQSNQRISRMMADGVVPSLCITTPIFVIEFVVAVALALLCAYYRNTWLDRTFVVISIVGMSVSGLVYIMLGQYFFSFELGWFPVWGFEGINYVLLPVVIGVVASIGGSLRFYRTIMLDEMYQDYVRTAFAKGASQRQVLFKHVLKNALIPILTNVVVAIPFLYTGSLMLESFFGIPGLGRMTVDAIYTGDEPVLFAMVFIGSVVFVIANLITDLCYTWADPRIRLQ